MLDFCYNVPMIGIVENMILSKVKITMVIQIDEVYNKIYNGRIYSSSGCKTSVTCSRSV